MENTNQETLWYSTLPIMQYHIYGPWCKKTWLLHVHNKGADQPAHLHSLISAFVIGYMESVPSLLHA